MPINKNICNFKNYPAGYFAKKNYNCIIKLIVSIGEQVIMTTNSEGYITQVIGPVIDVMFDSGVLPEINDAIEIIVDDSNKIIAEVQQHLGEHKIRSVAMSSTDGIKRGMKVINTAEPIKIPVGKNILGRIILQDYTIGTNTISLKINGIEYDQVEDVRFISGQLGFSVHISEDKYLYIQFYWVQNDIFCSD